MNDSSIPDKEYLKKLTVLYVEDESDSIEQFSQFLRRIVASLIVANDGAEGLEAYFKHHPDIILTDIMMPNMDGLTMAREIRSTGSRLPIIVLTAFDELDHVKRSINIGVTKYLTKPVNGFDLKEALLACAHELQIAETLQYAVSADFLTGLANRRELKKRFDSEKSRAERNGTVFSLMMIDIDHFKKVNDTFGHSAGDRVLKGVAEVMTSCLRIQDICGRWGGEEFLVILPETDLHDAESVAEKMRVAVSSHVTEWKGEKIIVTVSLGVGKFIPGSTMEECIAPADNALYRAKINGRNRYEMAKE